LTQSTNLSTQWTFPPPRRFSRSLSASVAWSDRPRQLSRH